MSINDNVYSILIKIPTLLLRRSYRGNYRIWIYLQWYTRS